MMNPIATAASPAKADVYAADSKEHDRVMMQGGERFLQRLFKQRFGRAITRHTNKLQDRLKPKPVTLGSLIW
jgi:hypothetical protein